MNLKKIIPILDWLPTYNSKLFRSDLVAGITIGIILIPQGIAYAMIAGLPPIYGLYTALVPQFVYAIMGSSRQVAVGPVAMDSLLVVAGVSTLAVTGTDNYIAIVILLTLLVGITQLLLGVVRLGFVVNFLSKPVISGFTSAAALIIGLNQFNGLLGVDIARNNQIQYLIQNIWEKLGVIHWPTFLIGGMSIVLIMGLKRIHKTIPGAVIVVVLGILTVKFLNPVFYEVEIVKNIPSGLPAFDIPKIDMDLMSDLLPIAFTLAIIGFLEVISIGKSIESKQDEYKINPNQELIALGLGNIMGSFFKSFASTASFSRSAINFESGAKTGMAAIISAIMIIFTLLFLTPLFYYLPKAVLSAIIITAVFKLISYSDAIRLWKSNKVDFWMLLVTFIVTLVFGIKEGIGAGVSLSLLMVIYRTSKPHIAVLGKIPNTDFYRNINRFDSVEVHHEILIIRFDAELYFANTSYFSEQLEKLVEQKGKVLKLIIIDAECINGLDSSGIEMLSERIDFYAKRGIKMYFTNVKGPVRDAMTKGGIIDQIGIENCFMNLKGAVAYYETGNRENHEKLEAYIKQSND